jgi:hypothetical protein
MAYWGTPQLSASVIVFAFSDRLQRSNEGGDAEHRGSLLEPRSLSVRIG